MKIALVYISPNGTTRKTTNIIKDYFVNSGHEVRSIDLGSKAYRDNFFQAIEEIKDSDIVGFGSPVYHIDILSVMHDFIDNLGFSNNDFDFKTFIYIQYAGITSGKALINAAKSIRKANLEIIGATKLYAPHFFQKDELNSYRPSSKVNDFCESIISEKVKSFKWDQIKKIFKVKKLFINIVYPFIHIIGKKRELPITLDSNKCKNCNVCINECPKGALDYHNDLLSIDLKKCIHCYHCVSTCKFQAIKSPIDKLEKIVKFNKKIVGNENPQNEIFVNYSEEC